MYDWGQDGDTYYIVMEYVRGADLKSIIEQKGALPSRTVAEIGAQVCSALSVAHGYDIIHRDIKPHNIMVQPDGTVKVMDFGIARAGNSTMTQTGSVLGTAHYVSPEQAQGRPLTAASDLYSLGVVLYEAATGNVPFDADTPVAVALKQVNETAPRPSALNPDIDPNLEAVIVRAMQKRTEDRYASADEMRRDLLRVIQGQPVGPAAGFGGAAVAGAVAGGAARAAPTRPRSCRRSATRRRRSIAARRPPRRSRSGRGSCSRWRSSSPAWVSRGRMGLLGVEGQARARREEHDRRGGHDRARRGRIRGGRGRPAVRREGRRRARSSSRPRAPARRPRRTRPVDLVVSKGPDLVVVPDIVKA